MWEIRTIEPEEVDLFRSRISRAFGDDADDDDAARDRFDAIFEHERTFAAFEDGDIIGTGAAFSLDLTVPGGAAVPMGGTTVITVQPTHRRRGVLRALMDAHLGEIEARGEPLAGLWASESSIYGRFGYGAATSRRSVSIDGATIQMRGDLDTEGVSVRLLSPEEAAELLPGIYEDARSQRAGMLSRSDGWWEYRVLADIERWRGGKSAQRYLVAEVDGGPIGYAMYRQKGKWENFIANGEVDVIEVIGTDPRGISVIWSFITSIDLFPRVEWWNMPVDYALGAMITDPRRVIGPLTDGLWVRLMDVASALKARRYESDGALTIRVEDSTRPHWSGTFRLEVSSGEADCGVADGQADVALDVDVLGSLYLGAGDAHAMADANRITGEPFSVDLLSKLFRTAREPWCPEVF